MHRLWKSIIEPIFKIIKPKKIIEIGSEYGINTKNILEYSHENNSYLITIDPNPKFNVEELKKEYPNIFNFKKDISLNSLKSIDDYDLILIDGDHNWYTVYNELKIIEQKFNEKELPIILLHDIGWPYGRRDLYYNPSNIPKEYLNPYEKLGILPGKDELVKHGLNYNSNNAIYENTPKNGVCTAVEDFIKESNINLNFKKINAYHGLGILYQEKKITTESLNKIILKSDICGVLEKDYLEKILTRNIENNELKIINDKNNKSIIKNKTEIENLIKTKYELINQTQEQQNQITQLTKHESILRNSNKKIIKEKNELTKQTQEQQNQITQLTKQTQEQQNQITQLHETKEKLLKETYKLQEREKRNIILTNTKIEQNKVIKKLKYEIENINNDNIRLKKENVEIKTKLKEYEQKNKKQNQMLKMMKIKDK